MLAGPLICATSQAVNDWFDREVDAINEPGRPIPSGRIPGRWGLYIAVAWTAVSLLAATLLALTLMSPTLLGASVLGASVLGGTAPAAGGKSSGQAVAAQAELSELALPLGDGRVSSVPQRGQVFACPGRTAPGGGGAQRTGEWIDTPGRRWFPGRKPVVEGQVRWPDARVSVSVQGGRRVVRANGLPHHPTGVFPIRPGSEAARYDRNPNRISRQDTALTLPLRPALAERPGCLPPGMIGVMLDGSSLYNAFDLQGRDAPAYEIQDACHGHPERTGQYHYHDWSLCAGSAEDQEGATRSGGEGRVAGYALDGFPIVGLAAAGGRTITSADLDECHGRVSEVVMDGRKVTTYHYQFTEDFPYTLGCFRGAVPLSLLPRP